MSTALWLAKLWETEMEHMPETVLSSIISPPVTKAGVGHLPLSCPHTPRAPALVTVSCQATRPLHIAEYDMTN